MRLLILLAFASLTACASNSTETDSSGASADAGEVVKTKRVCRREKTTGSRTKGERICKEVPVD